MILFNFATAIFRGGETVGHMARTAACERSKLKPSLTNMTAAQDCSMRRRSRLVLLKAVTSCTTIYSGDLLRQPKSQRRCHISNVDCPHITCSRPLCRPLLPPSFLPTRRSLEYFFAEQFWRQQHQIKYVRKQNTACTMLTNTIIFSQKSKPSPH